MTEARKRIGELLIEAGFMNESQLRIALTEQQAWGGRLRNHIVRLKFITEEKLTKFLSQKLKIKYVDISKMKIEPSTIELISEEISRKYNVLPLGVKTEGDKKILFIATSDPTNPEIIDEIQFSTKYTVRPILATDASISDAIKEYYDPAVGQQPLTERIISFVDTDVTYKPSVSPDDTQAKNDMIIVPDRPGGIQPEQIMDAKLPEEAKAILESMLDVKTGLSHEVLTLLMNKETRELLNMLIHLLTDKGIITESDIKQYTK